MLDFFKNLLGSKSEPAKLFYNTDMHCHILPGVDHGAANLDEALTLVKEEMDMGITRIIATPHVTSGTFENNPATLHAGWEVLNNALKDNGLNVELYYSAEYRLDDLWAEAHRNKQLVPMPNNYLLIENSFVQEYLGMDESLFNLQIEGFKPILAHPERYGYYSHNRERFKQLHNAGAKFQLNILSLAGYFGDRTRSTALWLIENNLVDFIGSDMHHTDHSKAIKDYIRSKEWRKLSAILESRIKNDSMI